MKEIQQSNAISKQLMIAELANSSNEEIINLYKKNIISAEFIGDILYKKICPQYNYETKKFEVQLLTKSLEELIALINKSKINLKPFFLEKLLVNVIYNSEEGQKTVAPSESILKELVDKNIIDANILPFWAIYISNVNLLKLALSKLPNDFDINLVILSEYSLIQFALLYPNQETITHLINNYKINVQEITSVMLLEVMGTLPFIATSEVIKYFNQDDTLDNLIKHLRGNGASMSAVYLITDLYNFLANYEDTKLSEIEQRILKGDTKLTAEEVNGATILNEYGYTSLQLAAMSRNINLVIKLIEYNPKSLYDKNIKDVSFFPFYTLLTAVETKETSKLSKLILDNISNDQIDLELFEGGTLADLLFSDPELNNAIINRSQDPLFYFMKEGINPLKNFPDDNKLHIAISHGEDFWSTGSFSLARLIMKQHPEISLHLITLEITERGGKEFLTKFSGFINPGATDSYPNAEFTLKEWAPGLKIEQLFQKILAISEELKTPCLGICAGAQNLALYAEGSVFPVKKYNIGQHDITFKKDTVPYFMSLNFEQQQKFLKGQLTPLPDIKFKADTAHNFAVKDLGKMKLGAISEDVIPMTYYQGLKFATQYHPEHYYTNSSPDAIPQNNWIESFLHFVDITHQHHKNPHNLSPMDYLQNIENCIKNIMGENNVYNE